MDSINKNQEEDNLENLFGQDAVEKIQELAGKANTCFFCTSIGKGNRFATRPMSVQKIDDKGVFWFLSAADSHKNAEIEKDAQVQLLFQGSKYSDFLNIYGQAEISKNKAKIKELWNPILKTWFTEGQDDPRVTVIKVTPSDGYYWDTKHGMAVAMAKRIVGAIMGKTMDDSVEGTVKVKGR